MTSKRDSAVALAKRGYRIFPLVQNGKTPALESNWRKVASTDPARVADMWTCPVTDAELDYNIGIALDANTLVVDVDVRGDKVGAKSLRMLEAIYEPLPATTATLTPTGGEHRYYSVPGNSGSFPKTLAEDIDLKGEGGYVVGPGSEIDGRAYQVAGVGGLREHGGGSLASNAPDWLLGHAGERARTSRKEPSEDRLPVGSVDAPTAIARAVDWLENHAPEAVEGAGGDLATVKVANRVGDFGVTSGQALDLMLDHWNDTKAIPPWNQDDLAAKVYSAFRSRQNAVGIAAPEAEFDAVEVTGKSAPAPKGRKALFFTPFEAAKPDLNETYLIDDILGLGTMAVTYGDSNAGKSFVVIDQAYHVASGRPWNGHKVVQGLVVYVAAEGGSSFHKRLGALRIHHTVTSLPFALVPCPIDLQSDQADTGRLIKVIRDAETHYGQKCALVVIDTLARAMGGGDENTSVDMSKFVTHCDRIREAVGATVNVIHHTGKDKSKGARGSSALRAATDTEIEIEPGRFHVQKQRDLESAKSLGFALRVIEVGQRSDGKAITSCVVDWSAESEFNMEISPLAASALELLEQLVDARRDEVTEDASLSESDKRDTLKRVAIPWEQWQMSCLSCLKSARGKSINRTALFPLRLELSNSGRVKKDKSNQWFIA